eukprot:gene15157-17929_t
MYGGDEVSAIVIDLGSNTCKGGYAGEDTPKAVFPSSVGVIDREEEVTDAGKEEEPGKSDGDKEMKDADGEASAERQKKKSRTYYVNQLGYRRDNMEVINPYGKDGCLEDWDLVEREIAADLKESLCRVSDQQFQDGENTNIPTVRYELPDGNEIEVGFERFKVPEVLFQPSLLPSFPNTEALTNEDGSPVSGLPALILEAIAKCDVDVRKELHSNILLTGGMSSLPVLRERLERELTEQVAPNAGRVKVTTPNALVERKFSVFIGGSILASLGSFQQMWMSKAEYEEH